MLASTDGGSRVLLWKGIDREALDGHSALVTALAFSPDGRRLASADDAGRAVVWGLERDELRINGDWEMLATRDDGRLMAISELGAEVAIWDVARRRVIDRVASEDDDPEAVALSPDGRLLAVEAGARVFLGDPSKTNDFRKLPGTPADVMALAFQPHGPRLAAARIV